MAEVTISTSGMTFQDVIDIARHGAHVLLSDEAVEAMQKSRDHVEALAASDTPVYGISTGFGALANRHASTLS